MSLSGPAINRMRIAAAAAAAAAGSVRGTKDTSPSLVEPRRLNLLGSPFLTSLVALLKQANSRSKANELIIQGVLTDYPRRVDPAASLAIHAGNNN